MKQRLIVLVACLLIGVWLVARLRPPGSSHGRPHSQATNRAANGNAYLGLRSFALQGTRENFGLAPASRPTQPFAVVMDLGLPEGATTVVAIADGSASVYVGNGGGFIGGGQSHESIRNAALKTVQLADQVQPLMHATNEYPLAQPGQVNIYVVTDAGVFTGTASEDDMRRGRSPFSKLGDSAQNIIAEYRRIPEKH